MRLNLHDFKIAVRRDPFLPVYIRTLVKLHLSGKECFKVKQKCSKLRAQMKKLDHQIM